MLDIELNRVVGIIIQYSEDARLGISTDCTVLTFDDFAQFGLRFSNIPIKKGVALRPSDGLIDIARDLADCALANDGVPDIVPTTEWVGRDHLFQNLSDDLINSAKKVISLVGFGGEGKSSLARRWLAKVNVDGVFWWSFYKRSDVEEFFEVAFRYVSGEKHKAKENRAEKLAAYLYARNYLFVLDGLEVVQRNNFDHYGDITNSELQRFLEYFLSPAHSSHCLITTRIPLRFGHYLSFAQYDVEQLSTDEGITLLQKLGVDDDQQKLRIVVKQWEGHALALTLIGTYLRICYKGRVGELDIHIEDIPKHTADQRRTEQVSQILGRYDKRLLDEPTQIFLLIFSAFRLSVPLVAISSVFRASKIPGLDLSPNTLDDFAFTSLIKQLKAYRIIREDQNEKDYTIHPLMRDHYVKRLNEEHIEQVSAVHGLIKNYYLSQLPHVFDAITITNLIPLIEAIYHTCQARMYDDGFDIYNKQLIVKESTITNKSDRLERPFYDILINWLGAHDTAYELLLNFFPKRDNSNEPQVQEVNRPTILKDIARCHMYQSRLKESEPFYLRAIDGYMVLASWGQVSNVYRDLSMLHVYSGELDDALNTAEIALSFVVRPDIAQKVEVGIFQENPTDAVACLALIGFIEVLRGEIEQASLSFAEAKRIHRKEKKGKILPIRSGLLYVTFLYQVGHFKKALSLTRRYLKQCYRHNANAEKNHCHRLIGDISAATGNYQRANRHYALAVQFAREFGRSDLLIEALVMRGRWAARQGNIDLAQADLDEALNHAKNGYGLYELNIKVGLALLHHISGRHEAATQEIETAVEKSKNIHYELGYRDAVEVLYSLKV